MNRTQLPTRLAAVGCFALHLLAGCDLMTTSSSDVPFSDRKVDLPNRVSHDEEEQTVAADSSNTDHQPQLAPMDDPLPELPPIELPPALVGGVTECIVDGVIFRATECYRTGRGFRLTIYCGSNEKDFTIVFHTPGCVVNGEPSHEQSAMTVLDGPFVEERTDVPRGKVIWFQLEPSRLPIDDTMFDSVIVAFDSQSTIQSSVEFLGIPVTGDSLPHMPSEETAAVPERLLHLLNSGMQCQTVWRYGDFLGDTILAVEAFDPETREIRGRFYDAEDESMTKPFEGQLAADGLSFEIKTIRGVGLRSSGTGEISNTNLYLMQQQTDVTFHLVRTDLLGVSTDGVAFAGRFSSDFLYR